jgi:UDP-N-acetylmuramoyl-L-alanyl-D-glutamate--2,6-diaminopimelate ligase
VADRGSSALRPEHPIARSLPHLVEEFGFAHRGAPVADVVSGITLSSKDVVPGDLYVGLKGARFHGASFATAAKEAGAVAVLTDDEDRTIAPATTRFVVRDPRPPDLPRVGVAAGLRSVGQTQTTDVTGHHSFGGRRGRRRCHHRR